MLFNSILYENLSKIKYWFESINDIHRVKEEKECPGQLISQYTGTDFTPQWVMYCRMIAYHWIDVKELIEFLWNFDMKLISHTITNYTIRYLKKKPFGDVIVYKLQHQYIYLYVFNRGI